MRISAEGRAGKSKIKKKFPVVSVDRAAKIVKSPQSFNIDQRGVSLVAPSQSRRGHESRARRNKLSQLRLANRNF